VIPSDVGAEDFEPHEVEEGNAKKAVGYEVKNRADGARVQNSRIAGCPRSKDRHGYEEGHSIGPDPGMRVDGLLQVREARSADLERTAAPEPINHMAEPVFHSLAQQKAADQKSQAREKKQIPFIGVKTVCRYVCGSEKGQSAAEEKRADRAIEQYRWEIGPPLLGGARGCQFLGYKPRDPAPRVARVISLTDLAYSPRLNVARFDPKFATIPDYRFLAQATGKTCTSHGGPATSSVPPRGPSVPSDPDFWKRGVLSQAAEANCPG
jgi:hypothetical protein